MAAAAVTYTATGTKFIGQGRLVGIFVAAAASTPTLAIHDAADATASRTLFPTFTPVAGTSYYVPACGITISKGLYVVIANTVTVTLFFEA